MATTTRAYLDLPADERFEARIPGALKRHAEAVARAKGESLSEYVLEIVAERVAVDIVATQELHMTPVEQVELLRLLAQPATPTPNLSGALERADSLWGE